MILYRVYCIRSQLSNFVCVWYVGGEQGADGGALAELSNRVLGLEARVASLESQVRTRGREGEREG